MNDLYVCAGDIKSDYLQAPSSENKFPLEWKGCMAIIRHALYGGKSDGSDYWKQMRTCMILFDFEYCKADPYFWMRQSNNPKTVLDYWEYVLLYVDDCLTISHRPRYMI